MNNNDLPSYKGVMICSRPEEAVKLKREIPFLTRVAIRGMPGVNPIKKYPDEIRKMSKGPVVNEPPVTDKYKSWLHSLDQQMQDRAEDAVAEEISQKVSFQKFRDNSKAMRQKWRDFKEGYKSVQNSSVRQSTNDIKRQANLPINYDELIREVLSTANLVEKNQKKRPSIQLTKKKPAWARTEEENQVEDDREIDDLVNFMDNFDAREYVEDVEVNSILRELKEKVAENLEGPSQTTSINKRSGAYLGYRPDSTHNRNTNQVNPFTSESSNFVPQKKLSSLKVESTRPITSDPRKMKPEIDTDKLKGKIIKNIADSLLKNDPELAKVHSNASLRRLIEGLLTKYFNENRYVLDRYVLPSWKTPQNREPITISHNTKNFRTQSSMQNLPYLYPSPLI